MVRNHTPRPTTAEERRRYNSEGQQDFGWINAKQAALRDSIKSSSVRSKKAAKRSFARPARDRKGRFVSRA